MPLSRRLIAKLKSGEEQFCFDEEICDFNLIDFWRWSVSDLVSNATRGRLAEFIIAKALDIDTNYVRDEWQAYDLITPEGIKIEVKSAAYIQSWSQRELSKISFSIKKSRWWDPDNNRQSDESFRPSDAYIFALLKHIDKETIDPLNLSQWLFFVLPTEAIDNYKRSEHSITLKSLEKLCTGVAYNDIRIDLLHKLKYSGEHTL